MKSFKGIRIFLCGCFVMICLAISPGCDNDKETHDNILTALIGSQSGSTDGINGDDSSFNTLAVSSVSCSATKLRTVPVNPAAAGPWPVGSKTVTISGLSTEVWYPATPGSEAGKQKDAYNMKDYIPGLTGNDSEHTWAMNSYRDLPIDAAYGPYPVIVMVHGTGSFKYASHVYCAHWASRGFVVLSADNPYIYIKDMLNNMLGVIFADQKGDTKKILSALRSPSGSIAFLKNRIDANRFGLAGHSAGGAAINMPSERGVRVIMPMASYPTINNGIYIMSALLIGGQSDGIATWKNMQSAYTKASSLLNKRLVGIPNAGHMAFTNVCESVAKAGEYGVDLSALEAVANDGCGPEYLPQELTWEMVNFASTAVFEQSLQCSTTSKAQIDTIASKYSGVIYNHNK